jgi:hypothetical protein
MKAAKTWYVAGLVLLAGLVSVSCGKDEGINEGAGGAIIHAGSGGASANNGGGRTGGTGGTGGSAATAATKLGRGCMTDKECEDTTAPGLKCVTETDTVLGNGAPPKGLCTAPCTTDDECAALGAGSLCYPFGSTTGAGYCIEGCSFGTPDIGEAKCHSRPEFACDPALLGKTTTTCTATADCPAGDFCNEGSCSVVFPGCLPACRGDLDCADGMYCDQSFLRGVCLAKKPVGKALGEPCTVPPATAPGEPDECLGFCQGDATGSNKGHCATTCGLANQCAWNSDTKKYDGVCFYASVLTVDTGGAGDFGFCTPTCNCTSECNDSTLACSLLTQGALSTDFRGPGLCFSPDAMTKEYNQCGAGGDGAGGESAGGAGPGAGGAGGTPAADAGAGGN